MIYDFDEVINRKCTESVKWGAFDHEILPLWVADMDYVSPEPVIRALRERVEHGIFGYPMPPSELYDIVIERLRELYQWRVEKEDLVFMPGVVTGFNLACHSVSSSKGKVLIQTPVYPPFFSAPANAGMEIQEMPLVQNKDGSYYADIDEFESYLLDKTRLFLLCNPHNPVGKVFSREELSEMAELCLRHDVIISSDEIHCDLLFKGTYHTPIASIHPEIGQKTITLISPSKTYNIAGLEFSIAIIQNHEIRQRFEAAKKGLVGHCNIMGYIAGLAAYREGREWLEQVLSYLEANRDYLYSFVKNEFEGMIKMANPEGTYLAWLDCRQADIADKPHEFFLSRAKVALNDGVSFGQCGKGFVRLNFACPRSILKEALYRMKNALSNI